MVDLKKEPLLIIRQCEMCDSTSYKKRKMYEWIGLLTKDKLIICEPGTRRETGSKSWKKHVNRN